jgi:ankyrin repeat protein
MRGSPLHGLGALLIVVLVSACGSKGNLNEDLLKATEQGNVQRVKSLLAKGADVDAKDAYDRTPLMLSAFGGYTDIAEALIQAGANISAKAKYGQTALQFATERGNGDVAALLRAAGAGS